MKKSVTIKAAWIGAGAIICAAIITVLFSPGKQEEHISQTGNTNVFSKDHVEGDKIVNIGPSDDDLERMFSKPAPAPISIPLVDLELKRVEADPNLAHWKIEFAYDILLHNKSNVPISKIIVRRQIDSKKNKQKLARHGYPQSKLKFFYEDINVLGSKEFKKIHREHSKSYEYAIFTITYQDEFNKRYKCIFEGDRDSVDLKHCALRDNEAQNST